MGSQQCSADEVMHVHRVLSAADETNFNQAHHQVVDQLGKVRGYITEGWSAQDAIQATWEERNNMAHSRLIKGGNGFIGMYPPGAARAFDQALAFLSLDTPDSRCSLTVMESTFRELDSDLIRNECSKSQENVIDDLWRLIKMIYNGAMRKEALMARQPGLNHSADKALSYLNPRSTEAGQCTLEDLSQVLDSLQAKAQSDQAQKQVIEQLRKVIQLIHTGNSVQTAIQEAWNARDRCARERLNAAAA